MKFKSFFQEKKKCPKCGSRVKESNPLCPKCYYDFQPSDFSREKLGELAKIYVLHYTPGDKGSIKARRYCESKLHEFPEEQLEILRQSIIEYVDGKIHSKLFMKKTANLKFDYIDMLGQGFVFNPSEMALARLIELFAEFVDSGSIPKLECWFKENWSWRVKDGIINAISKIGGQHAIDFLEANKDAVGGMVSIEKKLRRLRKR
jgi:hypothetical protein